MDSPDHILGQRRLVIDHAGSELFQGTFRCSVGAKTFLWSLNFLEHIVRVSSVVVGDSLFNPGGTCPSFAHPTRRFDTACCAFSATVENLRPLVCGSCARSQGAQA